MARKKIQSPFEDLIDFTAMLPWWVGLLLALIAYFVLHHYATAEVAPAPSVAQMGKNVAGQIGKVLASLGQYLLPFAFILGAGLSAIGRRKRAALFTGVQEGPAVSALDQMSWQEFEMLVGEAYRRKGYSVAETGGRGADGGIDLILSKDGEKVLVQCKQWKTYKVGVTVIRELYGVMAAEGATGGIVVTSGEYTQEAKSFAEGKKIDLIDGSGLRDMIKRTPQSLNATNTTRTHSQISQVVATDMICPKCGSTMVKRTAKQGANVGQMFWGCSNFPRCRGIVPINNN